MDLDGPILDTRRRHHACYAQILGAHGCDPLDVQTYWNLKRKRMGVAELLAKGGCKVVPSADFERRWVRLIEQPRFLELDVVQPGALAQLRDWKRAGFHLILASMRQNSRTARRQLRALEIAELFSAVTFSPPEGGAEGKAAGVISVMPSRAMPSVWIGDTEADMMAARIAGFHRIAVTCGIRSRALLAATNPDLLVPRLASIRRRQLDSLRGRPR